MKEISIGEVRRRTNKREKDKVREMKL